MSDPYLPPGCSQSQIEHWYGWDNDAEACAIETELCDAMAEDAIGPMMYEIPYLAADLLGKILAAKPENLAETVRKVEREILADERMQRKALADIRHRSEP